MSAKNPTSEDREDDFSFESVFTQHCKEVLGKLPFDGIELWVGPLRFILV